MKTTLLAAVAAVVMLAAPAVAQDAPASNWMTRSRDWSATLRGDATALHAAIMDSHPGVHDNMNPEFRTRADAGLAEALRRAETTTDAGGWWWAMRAFVASFDDGHVQISLTDRTNGLPTRWPGFLTVYRGNDQIVATREEEDANTPPLGARLIDCDGKPADQLAAERIGEFRGLWFLEAQRAVVGDWQFMNGSNPWTSEMRSCRFESGGATTVYALNWRAADAADLRTRRTAIAQRGAGSFGVSTLEDGAFWVSMSSFDGSTTGAAHAALTPMLAEMTARQAELRAAPFIVLDLRGNGGGSSHWSQEIAKILWGQPWVDAHVPQRTEVVEWRVSDANQARIQAYVDDFTAGGESAGRIAEMQAIVDGMKAARGAGEPYWPEGAEVEAAVGPTSPPEQLVRGKVFVLTDPACGSACLDAVDLWKAAGAIQIGRETAADTVYMDIRDAELPSGLARAAIPMKVWRGRERGSNEPQRPAHVFDGDIRDNAALQAWVRTLD